MKNLMNTYKKKMKSAQMLLSQLNAPEDSEARMRITSQVNCYNYFIFELERVMLTRNREKQREEVQSILIREVTEFNRQKECKVVSWPAQLENNDNKSLKLFSN